MLINITSAKAIIFDKGNQLIVAFEEGKQLILTEAEELEVSQFFKHLTDDERNIIWHVFKFSL